MGLASSEFVDGKQNLSSSTCLKFCDNNMSHSILMHDRFLKSKCLKIPFYNFSSIWPNTRKYLLDY